MDSTDNHRDTLWYVGQLSGIATIGAHANFWHVSNRFGQYSLQPLSGNLSAGIINPLTRPNRWFDYSFGIEAGTRLAKGDHAIFFKQLYAYTRLYVFDITVGIRPERAGGLDPDLSSGGLLISGNAMPLPRISIGIDEFTPVPLTYGYFEMKISMSNYWTKGTQLWPQPTPLVEGLKLHHKYLGFRVGGKLPVNFSYECHHAAMWGGYSPEYGDMGNSMHDWWNMMWARGGGNTKFEQVNAMGNHLGMQHLQLDVKVADWKARIYWQTMLEDGPARLPWYMPNRSDGLWGVCIEQKRWPFVSKVLYEFIQTTDQSGPYHDRDGVIFGGADDYYNHYIYKHGWSYAGRGIGTPLITSPAYNQSDFQGFENNRIVAHHMGIMGDIHGCKYRVLYTHSRNYGTYDNAETYHQTEKHPNVYNSLLFEVTRHVPQAWGLDFGLSFGADYDSPKIRHENQPHFRTLGDAYGLMLSISKKGLITSWK